MHGPAALKCIAGRSIFLLKLLEVKGVKSRTIKTLICLWGWLRLGLLKHECKNSNWNPKILHFEGPIGNQKCTHPTQKAYLPLAKMFPVHVTYALCITCMNVNLTSSLPLVVAPPGISMFSITSWKGRGFKMSRGFVWQVALYCLCPFRCPGIEKRNVRKSVSVAWNVSRRHMFCKMTASLCMSQNLFGASLQTKLSQVFPIL